MKVFDLSCDQSHGFEGWFDSSESFESQRERGLIACPVCGSVSIARRPSAPRLNLGANAPAQAQPDAAGQTMQALHRAWLELVRRVRENTEDVGDRFAEEARRIHYQETPARGIRGVATPDESEALAEEGIEVFSLPMPLSGKGPLQ